MMLCRADCSGELARVVNRLRRHTRASQPLQKAGNVSTRGEGETERC